MRKEKFLSYLRTIVKGPFPGCFPGIVTWGWGIFANWGCELFSGGVSDFCLIFFLLYTGYNSDLAPKNSAPCVIFSKNKIEGIGP